MDGLNSYTKSDATVKHQSSSVVNMASSAEVVDNCMRRLQLSIICKKVESHQKDQNFNREKDEKNPHRIRGDL